MQSQSPLISAIVLNYKTPKLTVRCVEALLKQAISNTLQAMPTGRQAISKENQAYSWLEILIVDNHSNDESIGYIRNRFRNHPQVRIIETRSNIGYGRGNDAGIALARGTYLLIINPDNELEPGGLEKMVHTMESDPSIGILAPQLVHQDGTIRDSYRTFPTPFDIFIKRTFLRHLFPHRMQRYLRHREDRSQVRDVDWVAGACFLMRRDFYESIGGFDHRFFLFFEDTDLCRRCWKMGKRVVYYPLVQATDRKHRLSQGSLLSLLTKKTMRIHLISAIRYFWKWRTSH